MHIYMFSTRISIYMHVYMAVFGHIYIYMQDLGAQKVHKTSLQRICTQEAGVRYTN